MSQKEVEVTIDVEGNVTMDAKGFQGRGCVEILDTLARGFYRGDKRKKREFHVVATGRVKSK